MILGGTATLRRFVVVACAFSLLAGSSYADDDILAPGEKEAGFHPLFNGKDFTGLREVQGREGSFKIENGVLSGRRSDGTAYWLSTEDKHGDFELRLQYKLRPGGNSGIFIRVPHYLGRTSKMGMEIQLLDDYGQTSKPTANETGAVYKVAAASKRNSRPAGEWNDLIVRCEGDHIQVTLNGEMIQDFHMDEHEETKSRPREGYIGLSAHTDVVQFQKVRIKELGKSEKEAD